MNTTKIMFCPKCGHKPHSQDKLYGKGMRLHNLGIKPYRWICTRCNEDSTLNLGKRDTLPTE